MKNVTMFIHSIVKVEVIKKKVTSKETGRKYECVDVKATDINGEETDFHFFSDVTSDSSMELIMGVDDDAQN